MKDTIIVKMDAENIDNGLIKKCAKILKGGGIVAFPTETVYGLGAHALNSEAIKKIFIAKGRPADNPLIIHISKTEDLLPLVKKTPEKAHKIMEKFWPGPLTIIFEKGNIVPCETSGGLSTVAIRMPNNPIAIRLIEESGLPIAAPSANISGKLSPTRGEHVIEDLKGKVDAIIVGGDCNVGIESTVLDMTGRVPIILRPGAITHEMLKKELGQVLVCSSPTDFSVGASDRIEEKPKSPGMKYTHYSPNARMIIVQGNLNNMVDSIKKLKSKYEEKGEKVGVICTGETRSKYEECIGNKYEGCMRDAIKSLGSRKHPEVIAANLFKELRELDKMGVDVIICESIETTDVGQAIMDRLRKGAGGCFIKV